MDTPYCSPRTGGGNVMAVWSSEWVGLGVEMWSCGSVWSSGSVGLHVRVWLWGSVILYQCMVL